MKDAFRVIVGTKEEIELINYAKKVNSKMNGEQQNENFGRWTILLSEIINQGKKFYNGTNENEIMKVLNDIDSAIMTNPIISSYFKTGENLEEAKKEIETYYSKYIKLDVTEKLDKETNKTYVKKQTQMNKAATGFTSPLLLALLTASIEISTVAYIIFNAMD